MVPRAIRRAGAIVEAVRPLGIEVRADFHTGEIEPMVGDIGRIAVHITGRARQGARLEYRQ